jgi:curved DNA binding protein
MKLSDPMLQLKDKGNIQKYRKAGSIVAKVLDNLIKLCKVGQSVYKICSLGDLFIGEEVKKVYPDIKLKGICFPTCISINNVAGHFTPLPTNDIKIKDGDLVKIELGVHIDGFPATIAYTVLVKESIKEIEEKKINLLKALSEAGKSIYQIMKPGKTNYDIRNILNKIGKKYNCSLPYITDNSRAPGLLSFQVSRFVLDGFNDDDDEYVHRLILSRDHEEYDFSMVTTELEEDEVYAIDILYCTGTGKLSKYDCPNLIYKRIPDEQCSLKLKASRNTLKTFKNNRFPINIKDHYNGRFKLGLKECINKRLVSCYDVMGTKRNQYCARLKFTVIVKDNPILITGRSMDLQLSKV